jgi:hypothetical protein
LVVFVQVLGGMPIEAVEVKMGKRDLAPMTPGEATVGRRTAMRPTA